jgi:predicted Rossmann fold flavoprotein
MLPVVVIGAGAAGLFAALFAAQAGARVLLLETRSRPGAKIRASGGGRCNLLPSVATPDDFFSQSSPRLVRNILGHWPLEEVRAFFEGPLGIPLTLEATGKLFPTSNRAKDVVDALLAAIDQAGVALRGNARVVGLDRLVGGGLQVRFADAPPLAAQRVILAPGGMSLPRTGSDGAGWQLARRLGHSLVPDAPALVPLLTATPSLHTLSGLSLPAQLSVGAVGGARPLLVEVGDLLFTHRGLSGPVGLNSSRLLAQHHRLPPDAPRQDLRLTACWGGAVAWDQRLRQDDRLGVGALLRQHVPRRLGSLLLEESGVPAEACLGALGRPQRQRLLGLLAAYPVPVVGDEGYRQAEVTTGGVPLNEVVSRSMQSRLCPELYFAGEMLDVTGRLGGYNFLWAWVTGRIAGRGAAAAAAASVVAADEAVG